MYNTPCVRVLWDKSFEMFSLHLQQRVSHLIPTFWYVVATIPFVTFTISVVVAENTIVSSHYFGRELMDCNNILVWNFGTIDVFTSISMKSKHDLSVN